MYDLDNFDPDIDLPADKSPPPSAPTPSLTFPDPATIPIPIDENILQTAIDVVKQDPSLAFAPPCIVCRATNQQELNHRFIDCTVLNDHERLKQLWIEFCKWLNRVQKGSDRAQKNLRSLTTAPSERTQQAQTALLNMLNTKAKTVDEDDNGSDNNEEDFPMEE